MALLTLKDIGKIYVSDGNVTVGIRGVNLSFNRGEFVAVTGKSGSGKSTLLNVISGMDTYEEGELYIEELPTSHYLQPDWEQYREKYISFIFQDYNIIESFTVLQNVELALMHIEDSSERRKKALELLNRVGLSSHIHHKGSKLSGGQKQRTVIARALAKDSPIILADEPTGNLDSVTSAEIIELLREVSKDKLVIVVTHNFEQVASCATRHVRIFDGAVESDHVLSASSEDACDSIIKEKEYTKNKLSNIRKGVTLGRAIFTAKPRLSFFLCFLMIVGTLGIFMITTMCADAMNIFDKSYMFEPIEGRLVITKQNGAVITDEELEGIKQLYGAKDILHYDLLLDESYEYGGITCYDAKNDIYEIIHSQYTYGESFGNDIIGSYPSKPNEVFLYLPISYQPIFGKNTLVNTDVKIENMMWRVSGVKYYFDNNLRARCLFTEEGFAVATASHFLQGKGDLSISVELSNSKHNNHYFQYYSFVASYDVEPGKIYIAARDYRQNKFSEGITNLQFTSSYYKYDYNYSSSAAVYVFVKDFNDDQLTDLDPKIDNTYFDMYGEVIIHPSLLTEITNGILKESYMQASLFFESTERAHAVAKELKDGGYIAVPADTTYSPDALTAISNTIACIMMGFMWFMGVVFLAFFINLCSGRTLNAFKSDMAIMRSMGIPVKTIRIGMYVRMLLSLIPAFIMLCLMAILIFASPAFNSYFVYLYGWQYALIVLGMLILTVRVTHKQIRRLFGESVKKALKGGNVA